MSNSLLTEAFIAVYVMDATESRGRMHEAPIVTLTVQ